MDVYQDRYLAHQKRKKEMLTPAYKERHIKQKKNPKFNDVLNGRQSTRVFGEGNIPLLGILSSAELAPSSCDRHGVSYRVIDGRREKALLGGKLVGGVGWIHRADCIILLIADMTAYKSPNERDFMPYLDAGVLAQTIMLQAESENIASCFVNPNLNESLNLEDHELFCGAIALGNYINI